MLDSAQSCWLWLSGLKGLGSRKLASLYFQFRNSSDLLSASSAALLGAGLSRQQIEALAYFQSNPQQSSLVTNTVEWLDLSANHQLLTIESPSYPPPLRHIPDPPVILFVVGDAEILHYPQIAVIGSRKATAQGLDNAYRFSETLSTQGLIPTSGLALGIDAKAHQGALDSQGLTVAVLGTGVDQIYPRSNQGLATQIVENGGVLLSEYLLGTAPVSYNFPRRNRIISGLSLGCLVIEASIKSGSLITARLAMEQGREVFALPGSIHNPTSRGCHQLIREGAMLVDEVGQIYQAIAEQIMLPRCSLDDSVAASPQKDKAQNHSHDENLNNEERALLDQIGFESWSFDQLMEKTGLESADLGQRLLELELQGIIACDTGAYQRIRR